MHSIPDVLAGYLLGACLLGFWLTFGSAVDAFIVGNPAVSRDLPGNAIKLKSYSGVPPAQFFSLLSHVPRNGVGTPFSASAYVLGKKIARLNGVATFMRLLPQHKVFSGSMGVFR